MFTITWNLYFIPLYAIYTPTTLPFHQYTNAIYEHNMLGNLWEILNLNVERPFWGPDSRGKFREFGRSPLVLATINGKAQLHHDVAKCLQPVDVIWWLSSEAEA